MVTLSIEKITEDAKEDILRDGQYAPKLFVELGNGDVVLCVFANVAETTAEKAAAFFSIRRDLGKEHQSRGLSQFCFVCEAWTSFQVLGKPRKYARAGLDPDRKEALIVQTLRPKGDIVEQGVQPIEMIRDKVGKLTYLVAREGRWEGVTNTLLLACLEGWKSAELSDEEYAKQVMERIRKHYAPFV